VTTRPRLACELAERPVARVLLALGSWLCSSACFDVQEVPVDPAEPRPAPHQALLIDDFEDGDVRPSSAAFAAWRCTTYNPGPGLQPVKCGPAAEGFDSPHGYSLYAFERSLGIGSVAAERSLYGLAFAALALVALFVRNERRVFVAVIAISLFATPI